MLGILITRHGNVRKKTRKKKNPHGIGKKGDFPVVTLELTCHSPGHFVNMFRFFCANIYQLISMFKFY